MAKDDCSTGCKKDADQTQRPLHASFLPNPPVRCLRRVCVLNGLPRSNTATGNCPKHWVTTLLPRSTAGHMCFQRGLLRENSAASLTMSQTRMDNVDAFASPAGLRMQLKQLARVPPPSLPQGVLHSTRLGLLLPHEPSISAYALCDCPRRQHPLQRAHSCFQMPQATAATAARACKPPAHPHTSPTHEQGIQNASRAASKGCT